MSEYVKKTDLLEAVVEVEYLGRPRQMVSLAKIEKLPEVEAVYTCNRKKCENCNSDCDFTRDIEYAAATDKVFIIDNTPSINIDRPQGEWIRDRYWSRGVGMGEKYGFFYKCSLCEYEVENGYTRCGFNFCPYCGAQMKGADDE